MDTRACPGEEALWPLLLSAAAEVSERAHVSACENCQARLRQLANARDVLRDLPQALSDKTAAPRPDVRTTPLSRAAESSEDIATGQLPLPSPQVIGKYQLMEQLSRGGQATVYRAWDPQLRREVAIKISHRAHHHDADPFSHILQEGALLAQIDHPHLARVYDCGLHAGAAYIVMELVEGTTLEEFVRQHPPTTRQVRRIMLEISSALSAAHRQGILHLDLKPANVMVNVEGRCKLVDFGLGWLLKHHVPSPLRIIAGTVEYMAPEQLSGRTDRWTEATDLFGLGGILCFLLTGEPPRSADLRSPEQLGADLQQTLQRLRHHPGDRRLLKICRQALAPEPECRFPSIDAFQQALSGVRRQVQRLLALTCLFLGIWSLVLAVASVRLASREPVPPPEPRAATPDAGGARPHYGLLLDLTVSSAGATRPHVLVWSPALGLISLHGLRPERSGERTLWRLPPGHPLRARLLDPIFGVIAIPGDVDLHSVQSDVPIQNRTAFDPSLHSPAAGPWAFSNLALLPDASFGTGACAKLAARLQHALRERGQPFSGYVSTLGRGQPSAVPLQVALELQDAHAVPGKISSPQSNTLSKQ